MNSNSLHYFNVLAEELHFSKAAQKLHITQPPLSRAIRQLEEELDVRLFERNQRNVMLTPAGEYLKKKADFILQNILEAKKEVKRIATGASGILQIAYVGSVFPLILPILKDFTQHYQNVHLRLSQYTVYEQIKMLKKGEIDIAFLRTPIHTEDLHLCEIYRESFVLITSDQNQFDLSDKSDFSFLSKYPFILFPQYLASGLYEQIITICNTMGFSLNIVHDVYQLDAIVRMVELDMGIAILPKSALLGTAAKVRVHELNLIKQQSVISACYHPENANPVLHRFIQSKLKL
ncbi:LysR substrate-binding domain-containing protein [uncultured Apibacter sp.]|uniref:LysR family transcriptional regulator n=1 Tax=uncultured Apibacter sp. TaxID=1778616 RepID=UPI0025CFBB3E|nr:LysR substrate-binding domain-containing protein [uncultured Apibacter sp.]